MSVSSGIWMSSLFLNPGDRVTVMDNKWFLENCSSIDYTSFGNDYIFSLESGNLRVNMDFIEVVRGLENVVVSSVIDSCGETLYTISCPDNPGLMKHMFLMTYLTRDMLVKVSDKAKK